MTPTNPSTPDTPAVSVDAATVAPHGGRTSAGASPHAPALPPTFQNHTLHQLEVLHALHPTSSGIDTAHLGAQTRAADQSEETAATAAGQAEEGRTQLAAGSPRPSSAIAHALAAYPLAGSR